MCFLFKAHGITCALNKKLEKKFSRRLTGRQNYLKKKWEKGGRHSALLFPTFQEKNWKVPRTFSQVFFLAKNGPAVLFPLSRQAEFVI
jgi:hypothetical protein